MDTFLENTEVHFEMVTVEVNSHWSKNQKIESDHFGIPTNNEEAIEIAKKMVTLFNDTHHPWQQPRELVNVQRVETKVIDLFDQTDTFHEPIEKITR